MTAKILSLKLPLRWSRDWTQQELAEFYRVESALIQAGLNLETEQGVSDEGDPWFAFCRSDNGEVFIHFARIDGEYIIDGGPFEQVVRGPHFGDLVRELIGKQPLAQARTRGKSNIFLHPAALLIALVGSAFFHSGEAKAAESSSDHTKTDLRRQLGLILTGSAQPGGGVNSEASQAAAVLAGVMIGLNLKGALQSPASPDLLTGPSAKAPSSPTLNFEGRTGAPQRAPLPAPSPPLSNAEGASEPQHSLIMSAPSSASVQGASALTSAAMIGSAQQLALSHDLLPLPAMRPVAPAVPAGRVEAAMEVTDAAQAVQSVQGVLHFNPGDTPQLLKLPATLTSTIGQGRHVGSSSLETPTSGYAAASTAAVSSSGLPISGVSETTTSPPASLFSPTLTSTSSGPKAPAPTSSPSTQLDPHDPAVAAAVNAFLHEIQITDVVTAGQNIVIYDGAIMNPKITTPLDSISFHFTDGSTLSLVGTVIEIYALHYGS